MSSRKENEVAYNIVVKFMRALQEYDRDMREDKQKQLTPQINIIREMFRDHANKNGYVDKTKYSPFYNNFNESVDYTKMQGDLIATAKQTIDFAKSSTQIYTTKKGASLMIGKTGPEIEMKFLVDLGKLAGVKPEQSAMLGPKPANTAGLMTTLVGGNRQVAISDLKKTQENENNTISISVPPSINAPPTINIPSSDPSASNEDQGARPISPGQRGKG